MLSDRACRPCRSLCNGASGVPDQVAGAAPNTCWMSPFRRRTACVPELDCTRQYRVQTTAYSTHTSDEALAITAAGSLTA